jgi:SAM-dependent methyltransferase
MKDWTQGFFEAPALDAWQRSRSERDTREEVAFVADALQLDATPRRLLDVPCGDGRHAVELAQRGHQVVGIDIAPDNARRAAARARAATATIEFVEGDMRTLSGRGVFDGVYCMGNSFGYFPRADTQRFIEGVASVLAAGGRFVLDTSTAAESILVELSRQSWIRVDDELTLLLECDYDPVESRLDTTYTSVLEGRVVDTRTSHHFIFTSGEIIDMLEAAGLRLVACASDLDGAPFELGCDRLLLTAERRA